MTVDFNLDNCEKFIDGSFRVDGKIMYEIDHDYCYYYQNRFGFYRYYREFVIGNSNIEFIYSNGGKIIIEDDRDYLCLLHEEEL